MTEKTSSICPPKFKWRTFLRRSKIVMTSLNYFLLAWSNKWRVERCKLIHLYAINIAVVPLCLFAFGNNMPQYLILQCGWLIIELLLACSHIHRIIDFSFEMTSNLRTLAKFLSQHYFSIPPPRSNAVLSALWCIRLRA